jgi:hypothetical protein
MGSVVDARALQWCLGKRDVGTVICAPAAARAGKDQRGVIVMHEDLTTTQIKYSAYKSSWLKRSEEAPVFAVGDRVRLKPGMHLHDNATVANKCLGTPSQRRYGIVCSVGAVRNGIQRNVEVLCPLLPGRRKVFSSIDWQELCEGSKDCARSLYPSAVLARAERCMVAIAGDAEQLKDLIKEHLEPEGGAKLPVDTNALVDKFGIEVILTLILSFAILQLCSLSYIFNAGVVRARSSGGSRARA